MWIGFSPITFNNEDLPATGARVPWETVLDRIGTLGFAGTERGAGFPADPALMRRGLKDRRLELVSGWCELALIDPSRAQADADKIETSTRWLARSGARYINVAITWTPERRAVAGRAQGPGVPRLSEGDWARVREGLSAVARVARTEGIEVTFHPHAGTFIETADEIDTLCRHTDPQTVGLCLDLGHTIYAGADPLDMLRRHAKRVRYIHLKDVDASVLAAVVADRVGFEEALRRCIFTELGRGMLDLPALKTTLDQLGYDGWLMVEQDTTRLTPEAAASAAREALVRAGLWPKVH